MEPSELKIKECEKNHLEGDINPFQNNKDYSSVIERQDQAKIKPEEIFVKDCCVMSASFELGEYITMEDSERSYVGGILEACMGSPNQQGCNMNEKPEYLEERKYSVLKEYPGNNLIDDEFVLILSATFSEENAHNIGRESREKIARGEFGQWEYYDGWVKGTGAQPGYAESTAASLVEETDWGISEDNLPLSAPPSTPVKGIPQFCCSVNSASLGEEFQEKLRIWMQESRALEINTTEEENRIEVIIKTPRNKKYIIGVDRVDETNSNQNDKMITRGKERDISKRREAKEGRTKELKDQLEVMAALKKLEEKDLEESMEQDYGPSEKQDESGEEY
ncbi:expressed protein [Phakopsora pachyrhizi]|uniref:Expressed protein n=1 Tax=Phakopsora pachyrhizi TaxID=170000 RepID=A0AAV0B7L5_PHAPC|nr:expressed protein [Phakopsora pachyrhizi]